MLPVPIVRNYLSGTKFCAEIEKTAGKIFRACVDFDNGDTIGRAYGGDCLKIKIVP